MYLPAVLNIKDSEAYALAAELARIEKKSLTDVVKEALREKLTRQQDQRRKLADRLMEIGARCSTLPVFDTRSADEIIGYDENGVPR